MKDEEKVAAVRAALMRLEAVVRKARADYEEATSRATLICWEKEDRARVDFESSLSQAEAQYDAEVEPEWEIFLKTVDEIENKPQS